MNDGWCIEDGTAALPVVGCRTSSWYRPVMRGRTAHSLSREAHQWDERCRQCCRHFEDSGGTHAFTIPNNSQTACNEQQLLAGLQAQGGEALRDGCGAVRWRRWQRRRRRPSDPRASGMQCLLQRSASNYIQSATPSVAVTAAERAGARLQSEHPLQDGPRRHGALFSASDRCRAQSGVVGCRSWPPFLHGRRVLCGAQQGAHRGPATE